MNPTANVSCKCGEVRARVANASPDTTNRVICYCDDCQAFIHHLGRADLLDAHGGADIVQIAPATLSFDKGLDRVVGLRLSPKGLYRWHTECCKTPFGNTLQPKIPFIGIPAQTIESADDVVGRPVAKIQGRFAVGGAPEGSTKVSPLFLARVFKKIAGWRLRGLHRPHPYFDADGTPTRPLSVLPLAERKALKLKCGPNPA